MNIEQAKHNNEFSICLENNFPDKFYDWKITVKFYTALHLLKSYAEKNNKIIGNNHYDINISISPKEKDLLKLPSEIYDCYNRLKQYSNAARYTGITDMNTYESLKKNDYECCKFYFKEFTNYLKGNGVNTNFLR